MLTRCSSCVRVAAVAAAVVSASVARAGVAIPPPGGTIDYSPMSTPTAVPAMGGWMLALLVMLLAIMAYRVARARINGRMLSNLLLVGGIAAAGLAGNGVLQQARAIAAIDVNLSITSGGSVHGTNWTRADNTSGVPMQIKAITPDPGVMVISPPPANPECTVGIVVPPGSNCNVLFGYPPA